MWPDLYRCKTSLGHWKSTIGTQYQLYMFVSGEMATQCIGSIWTSKVKAIHFCWKVSVPSSGLSANGASSDWNWGPLKTDWWTDKCEALMLSYKGTAIHTVDIVVDRLRPNEYIYSSFIQLSSVAEGLYCTNRTMILILTPLSFRWNILYKYICLVKAKIRHLLIR